MDWSDQGVAAFYVVKQLLRGMPAEQVEQIKVAALTDAGQHGQLEEGVKNAITNLCYRAPTPPIT